MLSEVAKKLIHDLDSQLPEADLGDPFLSSHNYRAHPLNLGYFTSVRKVESKIKIAFVDGGNAEFLGAPNFSVQLNRVYFGIFAGRRRIQIQSLPQKIDFFSLTLAKFRGDEIFYDTSLFSIVEDHQKLLPDSQDLSFNSTDRRLMVGESRADIGRVASIARRFAEWRYAKRVVETELEDDDVLVMDGTLRTAFANESKYAHAAYAASNSKGVVYAGLSKSSRLFTTTGLSLLGAIRRLAASNKVAPTWYYYPIADSLSPEHEAAIFVVKLSDRSHRVFRFEINAEQIRSLSSDSINEIFSQLSTNSSDLGFPGYPYGLVDADDNARVRHEELEAYRVLVYSEISKLGASSKFVDHMQSSDSHQVLNGLREVPYA